MKLKALLLATMLSCSSCSAPERPLRNFGGNGYTTDTAAIDTARDSGFDEKYPDGSFSDTYFSDTNYYDVKPLTETGINDNYDVKPLDATETGIADAYFPKDAHDTDTLSSDSTLSADIIFPTDIIVSDVPTTPDVPTDSGLPLNPPDLGAPQPPLCYANDFEQDSDLENIIFQNGGNWQRNPAGYLEQTESLLNGWKISYFNNLDVADFEAKVRIRTGEDPNPLCGVDHKHVGLLFRYENQSPAGTHNPELDRGYVLQLKHFNRDYFVFALEDLERTTLDQLQISCGQVGCQNDVWREVKVRAIGSNITAFLDNQEIFSVVDDRYARGKIGLAAYSFNQANFDDFEICRIE